MSLYSYAMAGLLVLALLFALRLVQPKWFEWRTWPLVYRGFRCKKCGSWRNHAEPTAYANFSDIGLGKGLGKAPQRRICDNCQHVMFERRFW